MSFMLSGAGFTSASFSFYSTCGGLRPHVNTEFIDSLYLTPALIIRSRGLGSLSLGVFKDNPTSKSLFLVITKLSLGETCIFSMHHRGNL